MGRGRGRGLSFHSSEVAMRLSARPGSYGGGLFGAVPMTMGAVPLARHPSAWSRELAYGEHDSSVPSQSTVSEQRKMQLPLKEHETPGKNCVLLFGLPLNPDKEKVIRMVEKVINGKIVRYWGKDITKDERSCVRIELGNHKG